MDVVVALVIFIVGIFLIVATPFVPTGMGKLASGILGFAAICVGAFGTFIGFLI